MRTGWHGRSAVVVLATLLVVPACKSHQSRQAEPVVLAAVIEEELWGFIDRSGKYVLGPKWANARNFSEGWASVNVGGEWQHPPEMDTGMATGGHAVYIDQQGKTHLDEHSLPYTGTFCGGRLSVYVAGKGGSLLDRKGKLIASGFEQLDGFVGSLSAAAMKSKVGYVDRDGKWVIELPKGARVGNFNEGLAPFARDGTIWGYLDATGKTVIEPRFDAAFMFWEGRAAIQLDGKFGYVDKTGQIVVPPEWDGATRCSEKRCTVARDERWGFVDPDGTVIVEPRYSFVRNFHEGLAAVLVDDEFGFIDLAGSTVIEPQFANALDFSFGLAAVSTGKALGYIDATGRMVIEPRFTQAQRFVDIQDCNTEAFSKRNP